jgi:hypothetical protein
MEFSEATTGGSKRFPEGPSSARSWTATSHDMEGCIRRHRATRSADCLNDGRSSFRPTTTKERTGMGVKTVRVWVSAVTATQSLIRSPRRRGRAASVAVRDRALILDRCSDFRLRRICIDVLPLQFFPCHCLAPAWSDGKRQTPSSVRGTGRAGKVPCRKTGFAMRRPGHIPLD